MAEQEVVKHTKKIYRIWSSKEHSFWHKLREFLVEVFIIVFAVTLSIWFHNRSDHANEQESVRQFMLGLKSDLQDDTAEMNDDRNSYENQKTLFGYLANLKLKEPVSKDTLRKYSNYIFNTTGLNPNNGRFEGFKSSGKIGEIENEALQNDIMNLYQEDIVTLLASTNEYVASKKKFFDFIIVNRKRTSDSTDNLAQILAADEAQNLEISLAYPYQVLSRYDTCISRMNKIMGEINDAYK